MTVWRAAPEQAEEVARLLVAFRDWLGSGAPSSESIARSVRLLIATPDTEYLLGASTREETPSAVCQLRFRHSVWTGTEDCWLEDLFVDSRARRNGLGAALVELALARARAHGAARIELDTNEQNSAAIALYSSLGFSATSKAHGQLGGRDLFMGRPVAA